MSLFRRGTPRPEAAPGAEAAPAREGLLRRRLTFYGWVQGVGFRWRAREAARSVGATGWVRNESDGSVTMEIQGAQAQIDAVIQALERGSYIRIERIEARDLPVDSKERSFRSEYEF